MTSESKRTTFYEKKNRLKDLEKPQTNLNESY